MVTHSGQIRLQSGEKQVLVDIEVHPNLPNYMPNLLDILDVRLTEDAAHKSFVFTLDHLFSPDGRSLPTTRSSLGFEVPVRSCELWRLPSLALEDLIPVVYSFRPLKHPAQTMRLIDPGAITLFLKEGGFDDLLRLLVAGGRYFELTAKKSGGNIPVEIIEQFIDFGSKTFGAYSSPKLKRQAKRSCLETNSVLLGYVAMEDSS